MYNRALVDVRTTGTGIKCLYCTCYFHYFFRFIPAGRGLLWCLMYFSTEDLSGNIKFVWAELLRKSRVEKNRFIEINPISCLCFGLVLCTGALACLPGCPAQVERRLVDHNRGNLFDVSERAVNRGLFSESAGHQLSQVSEVCRAAPRARRPPFIIHAPANALPKLQRNTSTH